MAKKNADSKFVAYLAKQIELSDKLQKDIANECGYENPNVLTMFKQGLTRVPMDKVPALATALGINPVHMMNMWLSEYAPEIRVALEAVYGELTTGNERALLKVWRKITKKQDPKVNEERAETLLPKLVEA